MPYYAPILANYLKEDREEKMAEDLGTLEVNQAELMQRVTFKVKMTHENEWKIRMWTAKQLLILAAWIANSNIEFNE